VSKFSRHITWSEEDLIRSASEKDGAELLLQMVHKCLFEIDELRKELAESIHREHQMISLFEKDESTRRDG